MSTPIIMMGAALSFLSLTLAKKYIIPIPTRAGKSIRKMFWHTVAAATPVGVESARVNTRQEIVNMMPAAGLTTKASMEGLSLSSPMVSLTSENCKRWAKNEMAFRRITERAGKRVTVW